MLGVVIHINGTPIDMLDIQNMGNVDRAGLWEDPDGIYLYQVKAVGHEPFKIEHTRNDGWEALVIKVLQKLMELNVRKKEDNSRSSRFGKLDSVTKGVYCRQEKGIGGSKKGSNKYKK